MSVRPSVAYLASVVSGTSDDDSVQLSFGRTMHDEFARQSAAASASPLVLADGMFAYLDAFPHQCAEQTVSKVFPQLGFVGSADAAIDQQKIRDQFAMTVDKLRSRQAPDGGFRFWSSSAEPHEFSSIYIAHFLSDARELGLSVPPDMLDAALGFLQRNAGQQTNSLAEARARAYAIYVLTRNGHVTTNHVTSLHEFLVRSHANEWRKDIAAAYMAASYQMLKQKELGEELIAGYEFGSGVEFASDFDTRLGRDAVYVYLLARHFPDRLSRVGGEGIEDLIEPVMRNRFNTLSASYTILALSAWADAVKAGDVMLSVTAPSGDELAGASAFVRAALENRIRDIEVRSAGGQDIYYVMTQTGFDLTPPDDAIAKGLEIQREYLDGRGNAVTFGKIGQELTVRLRVRSTNVRRSNIAVVDLLPGGFEVLTDTVPRDYGGWTSDHIDVREDRVVIYGSFDDRLTEFRYRIKLTSAGSFVVPSAFANSMYDRSVEARSEPGRFEVSAL